MASLVRLLVHAHPIRVATDSVGCAGIGWIVDPEKPFTSWRMCGQTKHVYTKNSIVGMVGYGVNKTRYAAAMISKQVRCIKRCDQVVAAGFKRCDACIYSSYAMRLASLMINHVALGMADYTGLPGCLSFRSREPILPSSRLLVSSHSIPLHSGRCPVI